MSNSPEQFWNWFVAHSEKLTMMNDLDPAERQLLFDQMQHQLDQYCPNLVFEVRYNDRPVDPVEYLP